MDVLLFNNPREFASLAGGFLAADPFSTTVIGVRIDGVLSGMHAVADDDVWAAVVDDDAVVGVAMRTPPHPLVLSRMPATAAAELAVALSPLGPLVGANGETAAVTAFVEAWTQGGGSVVDGSLRLYRLGALQVPQAPGTALLASLADEALVAEWLSAFWIEVMGDHPTEPHADIARRRIAADQIWMWLDDGQPVSVACLSAPAHGVSRIGPVYTPPAFRCHGYGAAATAYAAQAALRRGDDAVVLYADLANPTSNAIYQAIGFVRDHDFEEHRFIS